MNNLKHPLLIASAMMLMLASACGSSDLEPRGEGGWNVNETVGESDNTAIPDMEPDRGIVVDIPDLPLPAPDLPVIDNPDLPLPLPDLPEVDTPADLPDLPDSEVGPNFDMAPDVDLDPEIDMAIEEDMSTEKDMEPDASGGGDMSQEEDMQVITGAPDGEACTQDSDCAGGTCITEASGWPGGYCTTVNCVDRTTCARGPGEMVDNRCLQGSRPPLCVRICANETDCRTGYECNLFSQNQGYCRPDTTPALVEDFSTYPFTVTCVMNNAQNISINYSIDPTTSSYMVTTLSKDGQRLSPTSTALPDMTSINYASAQNGFQRATSQIFPYVAPLITPAAPQLAAQKQSGAHTLTLATNTREYCYYKFEESTPGTTIDLNIYLVGVPNLTAANAPMSTNLTAMFAEFDRIYQTAGVKIGTVRYFDASAQDTQAYSIMRRREDIGRLVATSTRPGTTTDDALSLNVFFVRQIAFGGGTIGISQGIPGPAGIHGTQASGVVFTSQYLGQTFNRQGQLVDGNVFTGSVMAHEIGHYLGLFHTTEQFGRGQDPLMDTPVCPGQSFPNGCTDRPNLMFPLAGVKTNNITLNQSFVIQANPLTKD